jgi:hypothetical protein
MICLWADDLEKGRRPFFEDTGEDGTIALLIS